MLDGFCEYLRRQGKSENTVKAYCQGMKEYMRWHEETFGKRMKMFLRANVLDYISYLRTVKGLSNRSVNAKLASLHSFNLYLIAAGYTKEVVLDKQDYLKVQLAYASPSTVSREEVERFRQEILEHCGVRDYAIVTILAYTAIAGTVGAGGLGDIAVRYGHNRNVPSVMWVTVVFLIILVQIIQFVFNWLSKRIDKRLK